MLGHALLLAGCRKPDARGSEAPQASAPQAKTCPDLPTPAPVAIGPPETATVDQDAGRTDPIHEALTAGLTPGETSSRLLTLLPATSEEEKGFLVQMAGSYCPDEEYWRMLPFLLDRSLPEDCRNELMRDVLRRPDAVRLRPLYRLAADPTHPLSQEAKDYLFAYLQNVPENDFHALGRAVEDVEREEAQNQRAR